MLPMHDPGGTNIPSTDNPDCLRDVNRGAMDAVEVLLNLSSNNKMTSLHSENTSAMETNDPHGEYSYIR